MKKTVAVGFVVLAAVAFVSAQPQKPMSPSGTSAAQVQGTWTQGQRQAFTLGRGSYSGGKWIELSYGRPLKRGRDLWGSGANYGKDALVDTKIWRAGANVSTQLTTEVPIVIAGKTLAPGTYTLFIDLKENNWTLVVSTLKAQATYDPNNKIGRVGLVQLRAGQGRAAHEDEARDAVALVRRAVVAVRRHDAEGRDDRDHLGQGDGERAVYDVG